MSNKAEMESLADLADCRKEFKAYYGQWNDVSLTEYYGEFVNVDTQARYCAWVAGWQCRAARDNQVCSQPWVDRQGGSFTDQEIVDAMATLDPWK